MPRSAQLGKKTEMNVRDQKLMLFLLWVAGERVWQHRDRPEVKALKDNSLYSSRIVSYDRSSWCRKYSQSLCEGKSKGYLTVGLTRLQFK